MLKTRLTEQLRLRHPIISAPMAFAAGGRLAATVSASGGLGLIGGGYGDADWINEEFRAAGNQRVGCGFITWSLRKQPALLDLVISKNPTAIFLSFDDPAPLANRIKERGITLICQIQTRRDAERALACGADVIVAQGSEAGGHGERRGTFSLVPEVADLIAKEKPDTPLCAAGGIGDGRGLAAALMLGADGVLIGSRLWASKEANVGQRMHDAARAATGDDTIRSQVMDLARKLDWPSRYTARVLKNRFIERWHGREQELLRVADQEAAKYRKAWADGDPEESNTFVGEVVGLIHDIEPASNIIERIVREAEELLQSKSKQLEQTQ
ncbi:nitronate monooxygenase [Hyphomicrobium sp.]|uniref:NAD(P)H-dependent flavin oxidoreductase n=1 Tax=Hyphomicrobium sp. TaxID=82 RepID=UPI001DAE1ECD|nr:nitronate monooxygenase [Hyphomicrobium sp.]MBY0561671.1 nitronate monooxygenase [Hyphomicrobium sp.]